MFCRVIQEYWQSHFIINVIELLIKHNLALFKCSFHPTPEKQNSLILYWLGQNFKMVTSAKHEEYILVWAEYVARGFQTLFIMREEGVMLIKTSGI